MRLVKLAQGGDPDVDKHSLKAGAWREYACDSWPLKLRTIFFTCSSVQSEAIWCERQAPCCGSWGGVTTIDGGDFPGLEPESQCDNCKQQWTGAEAEARGTDRFLWETRGNGNAEVERDFASVVQSWCVEELGPLDGIVASLDVLPLLEHELSEVLAEESTLTEA